MKTRELICIVCPNGCRLAVAFSEGDPPEVGEVTGNLCDEGPVWAKQEIINPMRTIASNILVKNGDFPLISVRTDAAIPRAKIFEVMAAVKKAKAAAPIRIGDVLIASPAGTACNIIATRHVKAVKPLPG